MANPYRVNTIFVFVPKVLEDSNLGLELANAFGVFKLTRYSMCGCFLTCTIGVRLL